MDRKVADKCNSIQKSVSTAYGKLLDDMEALSAKFYAEMSSLRADIAAQTAQTTDSCEEMEQIENTINSEEDSSSGDESKRGASSSNQKESFSDLEEDVFTKKKATEETGSLKVSTVKQRKQAENATKKRGRKAGGHNTGPTKAELRRQLFDLKSQLKKN